MLFSDKNNSYSGRLEVTVCESSSCNPAKIILYYILKRNNLFALSI